MHYQRWKTHGDPGGPEPLLARSHAGKQCAVDGCDRPVTIRELCQMHYQRWRLSGDTGQAKPIKIDGPQRQCSVDGCDRQAEAKGLCLMHYQRVKKFGEPGPAKSVRKTPTVRNEEWPVCTVEGCNRPVKAQNLCSLHYGRKRARGTTGPVDVERVPRPDHCSVDGCERPVKGRGMCGTHYARWRKTGDPGEATLRKQWNNGAECSIDGCNKPARAQGWCQAHYRRWHKYGSPTAGGPVRSRPDRERRVINSHGYVLIWDHNRGRRILEHRLVMESILGRKLLKEENVHHINGDRQDNRPENLELWSSSQPSGQRVADKLTWAHHLIELYADTPPEAIAPKKKPRRRK